MHQIRPGPVSPAVERKEVIYACAECFLIVGMPANNNIDTPLKMRVNSGTCKLKTNLALNAYGCLLF